MKKNHTKILLKILRILAVTLPFIWIVSKVDTQKLFKAITEIQWWTIPSFLSLILFIMLLQGTRWWVLLRAFSEKLTFLQALSYHFSSLLYSLVLPNSTAQEVVRTLFVVKKTGSSLGWSTAWICKIIGLIVSFASSIYGLILLSDSGISGMLFNAAIVIFLLISLLIGLSFSKKLTAPFRSFVSKIIPQKYVQKAEELREGIYQFRFKKKSLLITAVLTGIVQLMLILSAILALKGITGKFYIAECFAYIPLIEIISMAQPVTPNGLGVREALTAIMFKHLQLTSEQLGIYVIVTNLAILLKFLGAIPILHGMIFKAKMKSQLES